MKPSSDEEKCYSVAYLLRALESVVSGNRHREQVLVCVDKSVRHRNDGRVVESQGDCSNSLDSRHETSNELLLTNIEYSGREDIAVVEDLDDGHTVGERRDVQHVEQGRLGGTDTGAGGDDLDIGDDLDRPTGDLGRDTEGLEEGGLAGLHTGVAGGDKDIFGGEGTGTRGGGDLVGGDDVADLLQVIGGEDEADVALDVGEETLELGIFAEDGTEGTADHGVLAHHDDTLATESNTDLVHLVGTDIVDVDDEDGG